jgi:hypothetical protein
MCTPWQKGWIVTFRTSVRISVGAEERYGKPAAAR